MAKVKTFHTNFTAGQISRRLAARIKQAVYENGAKALSNCELMPQGGASRRPGTVRRAVLLGKARIEGAVYSRSEAYVFAFTAGRLDVYEPDGTVAASLTGQPWTADTLWMMSVRRYGNLTFVADQSFRTRIIRRTGVGTFVSNQLSFDLDDGKRLEPRHKFVDADVTLTPSATSGTVTLTASADVFEAGHVGLRFRLENVDAVISAVADATHATAALQDELVKTCDPSPFSTVNGSNRVTVFLADHGLKKNAAFTVANATTTGGLNMNGSWTVASVLDRDRFTFVHGSNATSTQDAGGPAVTISAAVATRAWAEPVFSAVRGWPQAVTVHQGRLWLAGSPELGDGAFGSRVGAFYDFEPDDAADAPIRAVAETQSNGIRHLVSTDDLLVFGDGGEAYFPSADEGLSQATTRGLPQSEIGASYVAPVKYDGAVLFSDVSGASINEFVYVEALAAYVPTPVSALCPEIVKTPRHACVFRGSSGLAAPCVIWTMGDGDAAVFYSRRSEGAAGWTRWGTVGSFSSFAALNERLYCATHRVMDGVDVYWLEEFDYDWQARADGCVKYVRGDGIATNAWTTQHGPGQTVQCIDAQNGYFIGEYLTGPSGTLLTNQAAVEMWIGRPFTCAIETLPPALAFEDGDQFGETQRIVASTIQFHQTVYAMVDGEVVVNRMADDPLAPLSPFTGVARVIQLGSRPNPTTRIESTMPERMAVLGLLQEVAG